MTVKTEFVLKINEPLVRQTMIAIADDLEGWDQTRYVRRNEDGTGVKACFAGRTLLLQGYTVSRPPYATSKEYLRLVDTYGKLVLNTTQEAAAELGLTDDQAISIFGWMPGYETTVLPSKEEQFAAFAEHVLAITGIDCR